MNNQKIKSLYQYLMLYGAAPHAIGGGVAGTAHPLGTWPNENNFPYWREHMRVQLGLRFAITMPCQYIEEHHPHAHNPENTEDVQVAYYATEKDLRNDRRTFTTPGRYLTKYCSDYMEPKGIAKFATDFRGQYGRNILAFAKTPEEIVRVFLNGPDSCMSKSIEDYAVRPHHPTAFYGNGITELAYLINRNRIVARTVVIPSTKVYVRVYGDQAIVPKLAALGYTQGDLTGHQFPVPIFAREGAHDTRRKLILPFIDKTDYAHYNPLENTIRFVARSAPPVSEDDLLVCTRNTNGCLTVNMNLKTVTQVVNDTVSTSTPVTSYTVTPQVVNDTVSTSAPAATTATPEAYVVTATGSRVREREAIRVWSLAENGPIYFDPRIEELDPDSDEEFLFIDFDTATAPAIYLASNHAPARESMIPLRNHPRLAAIAMGVATPLQNLAHQLLNNLNNQVSPS